MLAVFFAIVLAANTAGAKTYLNSKYGFSFECPEQYSVNDVEADGIAFGEGLKTVARDCAVVREHVRAVVLGDETETL
jgi:hypothetical protein